VLTERKISAAGLSVVFFKWGEVSLLKCDGRDTSSKSVYDMC